MPVVSIHQDCHAAIHALCAEYPKAFFVEPKRRVPLKHDIEKDIEPELANNKNSRLLDYDIHEAIDRYRSHVGYKLACSVAGNSRVDLRGVATYPVTEAEARIAEQEAAEGFAEIEARKRQKNTAAAIYRSTADAGTSISIPIGRYEVEQQRNASRDREADRPGQDDHW
jgi:sRNA-binding protein